MTSLERDRRAMRGTERGFTLINWDFRTFSITATGDGTTIHVP